MQLSTVMMEHFTAAFFALTKTCGGHEIFFTTLMKVIVALQRASCNMRWTKPKVLVCENFSTAGFHARYFFDAAACDENPAGTKPVPAGGTPTRGEHHLWPVLVKSACSAFEHAAGVILLKYFFQIRGIGTVIIFCITRFLCIPAALNN
jgi:hypothetical protein